MGADNTTTVFNNNTNEKELRNSKWRHIFLSVILVHHLYALYSVVVTSQVDISHLSENVRKTLRIHTELGLRFLTTWNFVGQLVYVIMELILLLLPSTKTTKKIEKLSWVHFVSLICPSTLFIMGLFWSLFNIDRELIFPQMCDILLPSYLNHSMHTSILVLLIVETFTSTRDYLPKISVVRKVNFYYMLMYCFTLNFTFLWDGAWIYPFIALMSWNQRYLLYAATFASCQVCAYLGYFVLGFRCKNVSEKVEKLK